MLLPLRLLLLSVEEGEGVEIKEFGVDEIELKEWLLLSLSLAKLVLFVFRTSPEPGPPLLPPFKLLELFRISMAFDKDDLRI